jgi:hypothetical protein
MDGYVKERRAIAGSLESLLDVENLARRLGVTVRFDPVAVERWLDSARVEPVPPSSPYRRGR